MMSRKSQDRFNDVMFYLREGGFRQDFWRVFIPVCLFGAIAVWSCMA